MKQILNKYKHCTVAVLFFLLLSITSCKKLVEVPVPQGSVVESSVFNNDATAAAALTGIYTNMSKGGGSATGSFSGNFSISQLCGLSADEFVVYDATSLQNAKAYYTNNLKSNGTPISGSEHWSPLYNYIFKCNAAIAGLNASDALTPAVKQQLLGEAKFLRAFFYFYLVNLYGDVPLALTTDPKINSMLSRTSVSNVYEQIIVDLKEAQQLLSPDFLRENVQATTTDRIRPSKWAATALLARAYLYKGDNTNAETQATAVINNSSLFGLPALNNVFLKNSMEAIWQIQPTNTNFNTEDGRWFIIPSTGFSSVYLISLNNQLLNSFEAGDHRSANSNWVKNIILGSTTYYYPYKYKVTSSPGVTSAGGMTEYLMVLRLGEQYLIRAEARAKLNNIPGAQSDLNAIRTRAGLLSTTANTESTLLAAILHERQVELFTEWGHRWFDLKRTGNVNIVMSVVAPLKGGTWQTTDQLYPLPQSDLDKAPNLVQNTGY
jgi:hypothetical protein